MARPISFKRPASLGAKVLSKLAVAAGVAPQPLAFFSPSKGLDTTSRLSQVPKENAVVLKNYVLQRGRTEPRFPVSAMGSAAASPVMYAADLITLSGLTIPFRLKTSGMDTYDQITGLWTAVAGVALTGGVTDFFAVTTFGSKLLFSNGVNGLWEYNPQTGTATKIVTSAKVPSARRLATFNNRAVATNVTDDTGSHPSRVRWSVKNNETLWDETDSVNIGAGFEDVVPSPGLEADDTHAAIPVTESVALLFRSHSVWLMSATGAVDAPFTFSQLFAEVGTDSPYSIAAIPGGAVGLFRDNFYVVTPGGPVPIGSQIIDSLLPLIHDPFEVQGVYDPIRQEYRAVVKETGAVWRYSLREKGWTNDVYPFIPKSVAVTKYLKSNLVIDSLVGVIDSLTGVIDDLGFVATVNGVYLPQSTALGVSGTVTREDPSASADVLLGGSPVGTEIRTGLILPDTALKVVEVVELQLEYESSVSATLTFEWSSDGGSTWNSYSTKDVVATSGPDVLSVRKSQAAKQLQFRVTTPGLSSVKLIALHAFAVTGAMRKP